MRPARGCTGALAAALILAAGAAAPAAAAFRSVTVGEAAPAFAMRDLQGAAVRSAELYGAPATVVVFWATWSPRSREILADLTRLRAELGAERMRLVAINAEHLELTEADREAIRRVVAEVGFAGDVLLDEGLVAFNAFGTMAVPSSLVVDRQGRVTFALAGYPTSLRSDLADAVRKALGLPTTAELRPPQPYVPKNHALMYYNFGRILMEKGQEEKAVEQLLMAVERDPDFARPHAVLGVYYRRHGRKPEALKEFNRLREIDPNDREALYQAALLSLEEGRDADGERLFAALAAEYPANGEYVLGQALAARLQGREGDFRALREKVSALGAPSPRQLYDLGGVAEARQDLEAALDLYRQGLDSALAAVPR